MPNMMVPIALWGYIPVVMCLFWMLEKRQAMLASVMIGVLFLPVAGYKVSGLPQYDKVSAVHMVVTLAAVLFDWRRVALLRLRWFDLPLILFCLAPGIASISNDLGVYDGLSSIMSQTVLWGPCYFLGRIYCNDLAGIKAVVMAYFVGGLIYVPFCLWEIRMSPQLHMQLYGFFQHNFLQQVRYGGYRPMVFMQHGLAVGIFMACASVAGFVLWRSKSISNIRGWPVWGFVITLIVTTVLCKSTGAIVTLAFAILGFVLMQLGKRRIIILLMVLTPPFYMVSRMTGFITRDDAVQWTDTNMGEDRANSLTARMEQEDLFSAKAMERPIFGWGGWGRSWPTDEFGNNLTRGLDSMWVMYLGEDGFFGLTMLTLIFLLPAMLMLRRASSALWTHPLTSPGAAIAIMLVMQMIDNLFNAMMNPLMLVAAGGLTGWVMQTASTAPAPVKKPVKAATRGFPAEMGTPTGRAGARAPARTAGRSPLVPD